MLASTASFINCVGGVNGDNPTEITRTDVDNVVRTLLNNNAYTITEGIEGKTDSVQRLFVTRISL